MKIPTIAAVLGLATIASAEVFLYETFSDGEGWKDRWTPSTYREDLGKLEVSPGNWFADEATNAGLRTTEDYRFYATSTKLNKPFNNKGKDLILQFDVKNEQNLDCGGGYLKFAGNDFNAANFNGDTQYNIMFGPDICGPKAMVHAILNYNGTNYNLKKDVSAPKDIFTHTYTLHIKPDQTYELSIDGKSKAKGSLLEDWDFLPPKKIKDPNASKPADWVDEEMIVDVNDKKPEGYDDIPEFIPDPEAKKPEDWDDDMDGEWEAPSVPNPDYLGPWTPKMIPNPLYKGEWVHPEIDNPEYKEDTEIYNYEFGSVGLDVWQVKSGTIFDNILVTDDVQEAKKIQKATKSQKSYEEAAEAVYREAQEKSKGEDGVMDGNYGDIDLEEFEAPVKVVDKIPAAAEEALEKAEKETTEKQDEEVKEEVKEHVKDEL